MQVQEGSIVRVRATSWRQRVVAFVDRYLPKGNALPSRVWRQRHRAICVLVWLHAIAVPIVGLVTHHSVEHVALESSLVVFAALVASGISPTTTTTRSIAMVAATLGLITSSALLTHFSGGLIEMHFHFFVMVAVITMYQAWLPFLVSIAYVVLHHGVMGALDASTVYNHPAAIANPWKWALIHGFFILGESAALLLAWRMNEDARADAESSYEQKIQEEKARREAQDKYREIVEGSVEGIYEADAVTGDLTVNPALARMLGYPSAEQMMRASVDLSKHWVDPARREDFIRALNENESVTNFEFEARRTDGSHVWLSKTARGLRDENGNLVRVQGVVEDITERKDSQQQRQKLEQQLRQAQKMEAVGSLAGGIAHDFNNLLGVIMNYATFLKEELPESDSRVADVEEIRVAADRGARLVRQLLAFSRKQIAAPRVLNLSQVVKEMENLLRRTIGEDVELELSTASDLWSAEVDPGQIEQILMNLAINARDAMPRGGKLLIETSNVSMDMAMAQQRPGMKAGDYACISVSDTGVGMTEEVKARIFEPFFTTKPMSDGSGLGLAMVYGIVKQADGYVAVYSEPGQGTTFRLYFPSTDARPDELRPATVRSATSGNGETILLVEDEVAVRELTRRILARGGYNVLCANSADDAVEIFQRENGAIDLLLTDVIMPVMSGKELSEHLGAISNGFPTLYMSGYTDEIVARRGMLNEDEQFIQKPFTAEGLLLKIGEVLSRKAA